MIIIDQKTEIQDRSGLTLLQRIEDFGRTAYQSRHKICEGSDLKFYEMALNLRHMSVIEGACIHLRVEDKQCFLDHFLANTNTKYFQVSRVFGGIIITGTVRAFIDNLRPHSGIARDIATVFYRSWPDIFPMFSGCYGSMKNITILSPEDFTAYGDLLEKHLMMAVKFTISRATSHELVRHRPGSMLQESQRYCLAGDTKLTCKDPHQKITLRELYKKTQDDQLNRWKKILFRQVNTDTGEVIYGQADNVFFNGYKQVVNLKTKLGYLVSLTQDHRVLTTDGWQEVRDIRIGDQVFVNGSTQPYKNREWLTYWYVANEKTCPEIAKLCFCSTSTIKKWVHKFGLHCKVKKHHSLGKTGNSLGVEYAKHGYPKDGYKTGYKNHKGKECEVCKTSLFLHGHHIDNNKGNNTPDNIMTVCPSCHGEIHNKTLMFAIPDTVTEISDGGIIDVYDITMKGEFPNFIANGVCVHNCGYDGKAFSGNVKFIKPIFFEEISEEYATWKNAIALAEAAYMKLRESVSPQAARLVLPNSTATEIVYYTNLKHWGHIVALRTSKAAEPTIIKAMEPVKEQMQKGFEGTGYLE